MYLLFITPFVNSYSFNFVPRYIHNSGSVFFPPSLNISAQKPTSPKPTRCAGLEVELQVAKPALDDARRRCKDLEGRLVLRVRELSDESERVRRLQQEADMAKARLVAMESQNIGGRKFGLLKHSNVFRRFCVFVSLNFVFEFMIQVGFSKHLISRTKIKSAMGDTVLLTVALLQITFKIIRFLYRQTVNLKHSKTGE